MASKNIKGITIEIGGNTTKLEDALKGVDKQVYGLNTDLKALNQALKLDPKNTELLAQKHDVLARNIAATKDRLETLKEAQRQMGDYNHLTDEQKASYNQLSLEIAKSENALRDMKKELQATSGIDMSKLKDGLKKVGEVALDVTKKLVKVTTAVSGALAGLVGAGVKSYADLEQNIGGIETMFGESEEEIKAFEEYYGKSWEEIKNAPEGFSTTVDNVLANANQAYKTAGLSANEYMETVMSFSGSLKQALKGDSFEMMEVADMAVIDMADNANKMGTDMSAIQSAYAGFAKQNYNMLDNLKLGYGGSRKEMERLLKDAEKLTGEKYDISNLADVYNAIHAIQEEYGIAGTTAEEAEGTITGSAKAMSSAFNNFLNGSGSPEALADAVVTMLQNVSKAISKLAPSILSGIVTLIKKLVPEVVKLLTSLIPQLLDAVSDMIDTLLTMITQNTTQLAATITTLINQIIQFITTNLPLLLQMGITILLTLVQGITDSIPTLAEALPEVITTIINVIIENIPAVLEAAITLLMALVEAIPVIIEALVDALPTIIDTIINTLLDNLPMLLEACIKLFMALVEAIPKVVIQLVKVLPTVVTSTVKTLWDNRGKILEAGKKMLLNIRDGIINNIHELTTKVKEIPSKVKDWIGEGLDKLHDVGDNFVKGIWQGISDGLGWIKGKLKEWVGNVVDFCKKILGIKSPSKVMADQVGKFMGEGVGEGFVDAMDDVEKQMASAIPIDSLVKDVNSAMRGLNYGIQTSINPQINPNITLDQNYQLMASAMKDALSTMEISLDDREVGRFVTKTITDEVYGGIV